MTRRLRQIKNNWNEAPRHFAEPFARKNDMKELPDMDDLTRKLLQQAGQQEPSWNFTSSLMEKIHAQDARKVFIYKPVISPRGWWLTGISMGVLCLLVWLLPSSGETATASYTQYLDRARPLTDTIHHALNSLLSGLSSLSGFAALTISLILLLFLDQLSGKRKVHEQP